MPRTRRWWRERLRLVGVTLLGIAAGVAVGAMLVHLIVGRWGDL